VAPQLPILDREHEIAVITEVVEEAAHGHGRFLVIEGDAGIGKTRLLEHARTLAAERELRVLSARGSELESEFAFGIVRQLFEVQVAAPPERVALLSGSAAGAAPVFESTIEPVRGAELPILHGLYWLTANLYRRPGVLLIDDLHWADAASLRYLAYLLPRLAELPLLVVAVIRSGEVGSDEVLLRTLLADGAVTALRPGPLSEPAVRELLRTLLGDDVDLALAAYCAAATAGNPLLLRALAATLARDGVAPTMANQERVTELGRVAVSHLVASRLARLAEPARVVARAAAVLGSGAELPAVARLAGVDLLTATEAADELTRLGLLDGRTLSFVHPVVGAAIYAELGGRDRLLIHARAADVLDDLGEEPERVAAHLLKTVPGVGTDVVRRLRRAAAVALCRGSPDAAFAYLRRCLAEDLGPAQRFALLREAATVAVKVDLHEAVRLFEEAKRYAAAPADRARILARLGVAYGYLLDPDQAVEAFYEALRLLPESEDDERRRIEATLLVAVFVAPGRREITDRLGGLKQLPPADGLGARMLEAAIAGHEMAVCDPRGHARARAALADGLLVRAANGEGALVCGWLALLAADDPAGLASLEDAVGQAHLHGSLRALAPAYTFRALGRLWTGQLVEAETDAREALRLAEAGRVDMDPVFAVRACRSRTRHADLHRQDAGRRDVRRFHAGRPAGAALVLGAVVRDVRQRGPVHQRPQGRVRRPARHNRHRGHGHQHGHAPVRRRPRGDQGAEPGRPGRRAVAQVRCHRTEHLCRHRPVRHGRRHRLPRRPPAHRQGQVAGGLSRGGAAAARAHRRHAGRREPVRLRAAARVPLGPDLR
jgi:tetratricopeptide (TPR) repeat protein